MRFSGKIYKDGKFWLAEIPILDAMTQGYTRKNAVEMAGVRNHKDIGHSNHGYAKPNSTLERIITQKSKPTA